MLGDKNGLYHIYSEKHLEKRANIENQVTFDDVRGGKIFVMSVIVSLRKKFWFQSINNRLYI